MHYCRVSFESRSWSAREEVQIGRVHAEPAAVGPFGCGTVVFRDAVDAVRLDVPAAEGIAVLARIAVGQQPVAPVLLEVLVLREYDDLPGVGIDKPDHLLSGVGAIPLDQLPQQVLGRGDEEKPRRPEVLVDGRLPDVVHTRLDLDRHDELAHDLAAGSSFVDAFTAVHDGHDDIVLEVVSMVIGTRVVRLLYLVVGAGVEYVTLLLPREEKDGSKVGKERSESKLFKKLFLSVHIF